VNKDIDIGLGLQKTTLCYSCITRLYIVYERRRNSLYTKQHGRSEWVEYNVPSDTI